MTRHATVAVAIRARDAADRLPRLVAHARRFADEVLVAVDEDSVDLTLETALEHADVVYRFRTRAGLSAPRTLAITRTHCDWVLLLDDDEAVDEALPGLLPELLAASRTTHWWLPRKTIGSLHPLTCRVDRPWFPDWQPRLVRADPSLMWESPVDGEGLRVMGPGEREPRTAVLSFRQVLHEPLPRGPSAVADPPPGTVRVRPGPSAPDPFGAPRAADTGAPAAERAAPVARHLSDVIEIERLPRLPAWGAQLSVRHLADEAPAGTSVLAQIDARNTGGLRWAATGDHGDAWPQLTLVCRFTESGFPVDATAQAFPVPHDTPPGGTVRFLCPVDLPAEPGYRQLHWDLRSDGHEWFGDCGSQALTTLIRTQSGRPRG